VINGRHFTKRKALLYMWLYKKLAVPPHLLWHSLTEDKRKLRLQGAFVSMASYRTRRSAFQQEAGFVAQKGMPSIL